MFVIGRGNTQPTLTSGTEYLISVPNPFNTPLQVEGYTVYFPNVAGVELSTLFIMYSETSVVPRGALLQHIGYRSDLPRFDLVAIKFRPGGRIIWESQKTIDMRITPAANVNGLNAISLAIFATPYQGQAAPVAPR